jgi:predicted RNA-binding protein Jag
VEYPEVKQKLKGRECSIQSVIAFCEKLIELLRLDLTVEGSEEDGIIHINLLGPDRPYLLTNSATLLNNMEYLLNKVFPVKKEEAPAILLDADKYRKHREAELVCWRRWHQRKSFHFESRSASNR